MDRTRTTVGSVMVDIQHLSYSSISLYLSCPRAWAFRYVEKIKTPTSIPLVFGSAFHSTVEQLVNGWDGDAISMWSSAWTSKTDGAQIEWGADTPQQHFNEGVRMFSSDEVINTIKTIRPKHDDDGAMIEKKVSLQVDGVGVPVIGFVDIIHEDGAVCDFKTANRAWSDSKAEEELQPLFYFAALSQMNIEHNWTFRHYVFVKGKTPKTQIIETKRKPSDAKFLDEVVQGVWRGIEAEAFGVNPTTWKCNPQYCEYWSMCRGKK